MTGHWNVAVLVLGLVGGPQRGRPPVRPGLDVLLTDSLHVVAGRRIGLVTNHAGVDRAGIHAVERLRQAGVTLVALFSPEHGFQGTADPGESVAFSVDSATGLPIYSLYGKTSSPTAEMLQGVDLIVIDLPDVGARHYTYISTTIEVMRAAAAAGKPVVVLDRPNPIGGTVQGPVLDPALRSFVGSLEVPIRHGMTLGEQARLANADLGIGTRLTVVPAGGWRRNADATATGLPFLAPSPNLQSLESLFHYPGTCLFEGTALSVGRGTDAGFRQIGAPWLDTTRVLTLVRRAKLKGVRFEPTTFTPVNPGDGKHPGRLVAGIRFIMTDHRTYDPIRTALVVLEAVIAVHPDQIGFLPKSFDRLAGTAALRANLEAKRPVGAILASWQAELERFGHRVRPFLLYR
ncbi:MAG: DUF1343 domain-containing protein [Gemmatimonadetes bacterium]|nr:DUF1343 domain-containing protein [Gemmatimonadota bacterium]